MKSIVMLLFAAVLLAGCDAATTRYAYKPGMTLAQKSRDLDACEFAAVKEVPRAMAVSVSPGYSSPGTVMCSGGYGGTTTCQTIGAVNIPGSVDTYDANQGTRNRFMQRCMMNKGYSIIEKPVCRTEEERAAAQAAIAKRAKAEDLPCAVPTPRS